MGASIEDRMQFFRPQLAVTYHFVRGRFHAECLGAGSLWYAAR